MDKSSRLDIPLSDQAAAWDAWNLSAGRGGEATSPPSRRQEQCLLERLSALGRYDLRSIDVGCGNGWICERLLRFGSATGIDITPEAVRLAKERVPKGEFLCADAFTAQLPVESFDVVTSLEVLAHVVDQAAFVARLAALLKPGGHLFLSTQNRPVLERWSQIGAPMEGTIRQWVDSARLRQLLSPHFVTVEVTSVHPVGDQGVLRAVNSVKLNRLLGAVINERTIERWKESAMLGHSLIAWAHKPGP